MRFFRIHMDKFDKLLAHTLRNIRKSRGLSQQETGKLVGLFLKTISALENHLDPQPWKAF